MRFLILNSDYPDFQQWLYAQHPGLENQPYEKQMQVRKESLFSVSDIYSSNLRELGHETWNICVNNELMQKAWVREYGHTSTIHQSGQMSSLLQKVVRKTRRIISRTPLRYLKSFFPTGLHSLGMQPEWFVCILEEQIIKYKPDVVLNQSMNRISPAFLRKMKPYIGLLVGQHAATRLNEKEDWSVYDLAISSFPYTLEWFHAHNVPCKLSRLGFDTRVLECVQNRDKTIPVSFVGSFATVHKPRTALLDFLSRKVPLSIWGPTSNEGFTGLGLAKCYKGTAWGIEMYEILSQSRITVNHHGDVAPYANNLRLFEATGVGTLLITDWKVNLHEMFELGKEVVTYRTPEECAELIQYYLNHDDEREAIARAGQRRTLRDHTFAQRIKELEQMTHQAFTGISSSMRGPSTYEIRS